jgi:Na+/H+ antiporter NhaC
MRAGQGDIKLLNVLGKIAKSPRGAEFVISAMIIILSALMGLNAPAILTVGASFAKPLSQKYGISPYRTANLLDAQSNTLVYSMPWTPAIIYTIGFAKNSAVPLQAAEVTPYVLYSYAMLAVMFITIILGIGRYDNMKKVKN